MSIVELIDVFERFPELDEYSFVSAIVPTGMGSVSFLSELILVENERKLALHASWRRIVFNQLVKSSPELDTATRTRLLLLVHPQHTLSFRQRRELVLKGEISAAHELKITRMMMLSLHACTPQLLLYR